MNGKTENLNPAKTSGTASVLQMAEQAKHAANMLAGTSAAQRNEALLAIAAEIASREQEIIEENAKDLLNAQTLLNQGKLSQALLGRLKLDKAKLAAVLSGIRQIAKMADPIGRIELDRELDTGLELQRVTCPIGLIGVIFEARPDALPQIASLCLKSANGVILKGGSEAEYSNRVLFNCLQKAVVRVGLSSQCLVLLESRADVSELLTADRFVDLIIPRGSNSLVRHIQDNTHIPVLGHAEGICHVYVDDSADLNKAVQIICDAKVQYPSACNAVETVLVHKDLAAELMPKLARQLTEQNVEMRCDESALKAALGIVAAANNHATGTNTGNSVAAAAVNAGAADSGSIVAATEEDWCTEYGDLTIAIKIVKDIDEAIEHINRYGSGHTEAMIGENKENFEKFFAQVNSAGVYLNASTRFADGFRYGFGAEVGISTAKQHPRGPVGIEGLVTYKYKLIGNGHIVSDYVGADARQFTHIDLKRQAK